MLPSLSGKDSVLARGQCTNLTSHACQMSKEHQMTIWRYVPTLQSIVKSVSVKLLFQSSGKPLAMWCSSSTSRFIFVMMFHDVPISKPREKENHVQRVYSLL
ncbi:hypothetical protein GE21DRAFT_1199952 [Neurospora crassa]|nr:hypothetical protein 13E11.390 [imported] - Neurospora crassa [Neurospora crassa]KHE88266.1 hypothetical protein GE21DRAFT_1199952 [Neurospora crassa]